MQKAAIEKRVGEMLALAPQTTISILDLIFAIQSEMKLTVIMITHQMEAARCVFGCRRS